MSATPTFEVEIGNQSPTANSLASIAFADQYWSNNGAPDDWFVLADLVKQDCLRRGTQYLMLKYAQRWLGRRVTIPQALDWPRYGTYDRDGFAVGSNIVPVEIQSAVSYMARIAHATSNLLADQPTPYSGIKSESVSVGPIRTETQYMGSKSIIPRYPTIEQMIKHLIVPPGTMFRS